MNRIVLAYSGGVVTSVAIPWLASAYDADIVTVTLDLGQGLELAPVRERALAAGAIRAHVIDARDEFVRDYILPALQSGALPPGRSMGTELSRPLIARRLVDMARMENASKVAHGCLCTDEDRARLDASIAALDPSLEILAPACAWNMSPDQVVEYARDRRIPVAPPGPHDNVDANVWGRSICGSAAGRPYTLTRAPEEGPDEPAFMDIEFERGVPVRTNGLEMPMIELIESLETIAGTHGVGRFPVRPNASGTGDVLSESPAAVVLSTAHAALARRIGDAELKGMRDGLSSAYTRLIDSGEWFSPTREAIDGFARALAQRVTGSVRLRLLKGMCEVVS
ncbi:MAG: argininosuccinate synthase domain-containing protein [Vicinamibacterales bacterium]